MALDNTGFEFLCELKNLDDNCAEAETIEKRLNQAEPAIFAALYQAMPKKMDLFELILQKCTEIGISEFVPVISEFCEREFLSKRERLEKILREAAEQCERGKIPVLRKEINFIEALNADDLKYPVLLHSRGQNLSLFSQAEKVRETKKCELFIGPEGGFSQQEVEAARNKGFHICSLGPRILRTETAAITAASLVLTC